MLDKYRYYLRITFFACLTALCFAFFACAAPTAPPVPSDTLPTWTIEGTGDPNVDGVVYGPSVLLDESLPAGPYVLPSDRTSQAVNPGTDMTVAELKLYFSVNIVKATFPSKYYWCMVWPIIYGTISAQPDYVVLSWVVIMENAGFDVPTKAEAAAAGMLKKLC